MFYPHYTEAASRMCSAKKLFRKTLQNLHEINCGVVSFLRELQAVGLQLY